MELPTGSLKRTPKEALGTLLDAHFLGARITMAPETEQKSLKNRTNRINWEKTKKMLTRIR